MPNNRCNYPSLTFFVVCFLFLRKLSYGCHSFTHVFTIKSLLIKNSQYANLKLQTQQVSKWTELVPLETFRLVQMG